MGGVKVSCQSCQLVRINGLVCHETGCPDAWRTELRECRECGTEFVPDTRRQLDCSGECWRAYVGLAELCGD